jgi:hypothetical protein
MRLLGNVGRQARRRGALAPGEAVLDQKLFGGGGGVLAAAHVTKAAAARLKFVAHFIQLLDGSLSHVANVLTAAVITVAALASRVVLALLVDLFAGGIRVTRHARLALSLLPLLLLSRGRIGIGIGIGALSLGLALRAGLAGGDVVLFDVAFVDAAAVVTETAAALGVVFASLVDLGDGRIGVAGLAGAAALGLGFLAFGGRGLLGLRLLDLLLLDTLAVFVKARVGGAVQEAASVAELALAGVSQVEAFATRRGGNGFALGVGVFAILTELAFSGVAKGAADFLAGRHGGVGVARRCGD